MREDLPAPPPYGSGTLADVLPSAAHLLGVSGFADGLSLRDAVGGSRAPESVTVLLVDGLGWWPWHEVRDLTPSLAGMQARPLSTTVPSTTPTALASLGTGLPPGAHGIVGAAFRVPEDDLVLHPLSWGSDPHPMATQPEPTVFERVAGAGVPVLRVGASAYADSGLTRAALRGGAYAGADSFDDVVEAIAGHHAGLCYAYVPDLDRTGHVHGVDSSEWRSSLRSVDRMVTRILERVNEDHLLVVTADHGMVDCSPAARVSMEELPLFSEVQTVAGEPRLRHVYCSPEATQRVRAAWQESLGERADVIAREDAVASGLLGPLDEAYADRIGDIVVLARGDTVLASEVDPLISGLVGQHGSVTAAEMQIPLLMARGTRHG